MQRRPVGDDGPEAVPGPERSGGLRARLQSLRTRVVLASVGLLALSTLASVGVARQVLVAQLEARIDEDLVQEATELRSLAEGNDPETAEPFGDRLDRVFRVHLMRNVPSENEAQLTFLAGEPYLRSRTVTPYRLDQDPELVARWGSVTESDRGWVETPAGRVEYLAVPVEVEGEVRGVFVTAIFRDRSQARLDAAVRAIGGVGAASVLVGSLLAVAFAQSVVRPVRTLTATARAIGDTDLTRRIPVTGRDELGELARTFNHMLDRLEHAFTTQRHFLDDAGHELRTPITILRGHLELMGDDPEERRETVELVLDELDRMNRIVGDLLLLAKAQQPDFLRLETVDLAELTAELSAKTQALGPRDWVLEATGRGLLVADRQRVTQAVVQLAQNAVQHTAEGAEIALGSYLGDGEARLWVRDTGPGVAAEEQGRVFDRFVRARGNRQRDGAGLGLSIVRAIAEAHDGRVELRSRPGAGATFTLVLPVGGPGAPALASGAATKGDEG